MTNINTLYSTFLVETFRDYVADARNHPAEAAMSVLNEPYLSMMVRSGEEYEASVACGTLALIGHIVPDERVIDSIDKMEMSMPLIERATLKRFRREVRKGHSQNHMSWDLLAVPLWRELLLRGPEDPVTQWTLRLLAVIGIPRGYHNHERGIEKMMVDGAREGAQMTFLPSTPPRRWGDFSLVHLRVDGAKKSVA